MRTSHHALSAAGKQQLNTRHQHFEEKEVEFEDVSPATANEEFIQQHDNNKDEEGLLLHVDLRSHDIEGNALLPSSAVVSQQSNGQLEGAQLRKPKQIKFKPTKESCLGIIKGIGWITFAVTFNVANTVIFSTLFPKLLHHIIVSKGSSAETAKFSTAFATVNSITTLLSALALPIFGSLCDELRITKLSLIVCEYIGIALILVIPFLHHLESANAQLVILQAIFVFSMFFLRVSVMNDNAILGHFPKKSRLSLALLSSFCGFVVNLVLLALLKRLPGDIFANFPGKMQNESWWVLILGLFTAVVTMLTFFAPGDPPLAPVGNSSNTGPDSSTGKKKVATRKSPIKVIRDCIASLKETIALANSDQEFRNTWLYLLGYFFFAPGGTIITIYLSPLFIELYNVSLQDEVGLNLYYKMAMVGGILVGLFFEHVMVRFVADVALLLLLALAYVLCISALFVVTTVVKSMGGGVTGDTLYYVTLGLVLVLGCFYSWNMSLSRALMSKLHFWAYNLGFYSTFTYLGISLVSFIYGFLRKRFGTQSLFALLVIFILPSFVFLLILFRNMRRAKKLQQHDQQHEHQQENVQQQQEEQEQEVQQ